MRNSNFPRGSRLGAISLLTFLALAAGCSHQPKVSYQFDSKTNFAAFKTYAVEPTHSPTLALRELSGKPMTQVVQESIERQLDARGLHKVESASADLLVRWAAQIEYDQAGGVPTAPTVNLNSKDPGVVLDSSSGGGDAPDEVSKGGIRVDLINAHSQQVVWRGGVATVLKPNAPDPQRIETLNAAIASLFANYPPPTPPKPAAP